MKDNLVHCTIKKAFDLLTMIQVSYSPNKHALWWFYGRKQRHFARYSTVFLPGQILEISSDIGNYCSTAFWVFPNISGYENERHKLGLTSSLWFHVGIQTKPT